MFKKSPLPFQGQKRAFTSYIINNKNELDNYINDKTIIIDVFGGSGLLSHVFACLYPNNKIIYNDYDEFSQMYKAENIEKLNNVINEINNVINGKYKKEKRISKEDTIKIKTMIKNLNLNNHFKNILSSLYGYSGNKVKFDNIESADMWAKTFDKCYDVKYDDYIKNNISIIKKDYYDIFQDYYNNDNIFYILDPPYLYTDNGKYVKTSEDSKWFNVGDTLNILYQMFTKKNFKGLFFNSYKSEFHTMFNFTKVITNNDKIKIIELAKTRKKINGFNGDFDDEYMWLIVN